MERHQSIQRLVLGLLLTIAYTFTSCVETVDNQQVVYYNDFSEEDLAGFENARIFIWNNDTTLGNYHNEEVSLSLQNLPTHDYLKVTVEIYIHDSWDGNPGDGVGEPDIWYMGLDGVETFRTTFSNSPCESTYCLHQSYPNEYFRQNRPKSGAIDTNLPGLCIFGPIPNYTTKYAVTQLIPHEGTSVRLFMGDELKARFAPDPICDESWSITSIQLEAIQTK